MSALLGFGGVIGLIVGALCMVGGMILPGFGALTIGMLCFGSKRRDPVDAMQGCFVVLIVLGVLAKIITTFGSP